MSDEYQRGRDDERKAICDGLQATLDRYEPDNRLDEDTLRSVITTRGILHMIKTGLVQANSNG